MKTMLLTAVIIALCTVGLCWQSMNYIDEITDEISDRALMLMHYAEDEQYEAAQEVVTIIANQWHAAQPVLSMIADHDDLHDVTEHIVEGQIHLKYRHANDFYHSMALLDESLRHMRDSERLSLSNLF